MIFLGVDAVEGRDIFIKFRARHHPVPSLTILPLGRYSGELCHFSDTFF